MVQKFPGKVSRNSGNCWISEMVEPLNRKNPGAKLNGKKTSGKKYTSNSIPREVFLFFGNFGKCCSIRYWKLLKIKTRRFGWMESACSPVFPEIRVPFSPKQSLRLSRPFFGKWDSFVQMINAIPGEIYQSWILLTICPNREPTGFLRASLSTLGRNAWQSPKTVCVVGWVKRNVRFLSNLWPSVLFLRSAKISGRAKKE